MNPNKTELADDFICAIAEARRLYATRKVHDVFWEQDGRIAAKAAAEIGAQAKIDAMRRSCGYAEKHLAALAEAAGLPEALGLRCARALRPWDVSDADWAKTRELLETWAAGEQAAALEPAAVAGATPEPVKVKEPQKNAFKAYRAHRFTGRKQKDIADELNTNQGQVSRWINQTKAWIKAGNVLPDFPKPPPRRTRSVDPRQIEVGNRTDGLTPRMRQKPSDD